MYGNSRHPDEAPDGCIRDISNGPPGCSCYSCRGRDAFFGLKDPDENEYEDREVSLAEVEEALGMLSSEKPEPGQVCPECETGFLVVKMGKYGAFLGCKNFPKCTTSFSIRK